MCTYRQKYWEELVEPIGSYASIKMRKVEYLDEYGVYINLTLGIKWHMIDWLID